MDERLIEGDEAEEWEPEQRWDRHPVRPAVGGRCRVIRTAILRGSVELDSPQVGELQRGDVISVLEVREILLNSPTGGRAVRVRCEDGWTSVKSRAGNKMLIPEELARADNSTPASPTNSSADLEESTSRFTLDMPARVSGSLAHEPQSFVNLQKLKANSCLCWLLVWLLLIAYMWVQLQCGGLCDS